MVYPLIPLLLGAHAMVEVVNTWLSLENTRIKIEKKSSNHPQIKYLVFDPGNYLKMFWKRES